MAQVRTFKEAASVIIQDTGLAMLEDVDGIRERIENEVNQINKLFFKTLATMGTNVPGPPDLDEHTPEWEPLSPGHLARKRRLYGNTNFFTFRGTLRRSLFRQQVTTVFGTPQVDFQHPRQIGNPDVAYTSFINAAGRTQWQGRMIAGPRRGKFATKDDIYRMIPGSISVTPFPGQYYGDEEFAFAGRSPSVHYKLKRQNHPHRPLLGPFMDWWIDTKLTHAVERIIRGR